MSIFDVGKEKREKEARDIASSERLAALSSTRATTIDERMAEQEERMGRVGEMQANIGDRLTERRGLRQPLADVAALPALQNIAEQEGYARRQVGMEGSLGQRRRENIATQSDLARQDVRAQSLGQQIQTEQGMQQLQNEFSAMFNDMASTQFTQQLSGLGEEIDQYMASKGRDLKYSDLATKAQVTSDRMMSRLLSGMGKAFGDEGEPEVGSSDYYAPDFGAYGDEYG